jgi:hypothetical protein
MNGDGETDFRIQCGDGSWQPTVLACDHVMNDGVLPYHFLEPKADGSWFGEMVCKECFDASIDPSVAPDAVHMHCWPCCQKFLKATGKKFQM